MYIYAYMYVYIHYMYIGKSPGGFSPYCRTPPISFSDLACFQARGSVHRKVVSLDLMVFVDLVKNGPTTVTGWFMKEISKFTDGKSTEISIKGNYHKLKNYKICFQSWFYRHCQLSDVCIYILEIMNREKLHQ